MLFSFYYGVIWTVPVFGLFFYFSGMKTKIADLEFEPLIKAEALEERIKQLGLQINADYAHCIPVFVGVLNGSFLFIADLIKQIDIPCEITFTKLASYYGGVSSSLKIRDDIDFSVDIKGRDVLIIEDIVDTGNTAHYLIEKLKLSQPASIKLCSLLLKPAALLNKIDELKYIGFEIENEFVVGYGLDYKEMGRNLKDIYKRVK
jgi:hypoxanthine phosphoribosyltransferase